jgi:hypothetical protein
MAQFQAIVILLRKSTRRNQEELMLNSGIITLAHVGSKRASSMLSHNSSSLLKAHIASLCNLRSNTGKPFVRVDFTPTSTAISAFPNLPIHCQFQTFSMSTGCNCAQSDTEVNASHYFKSFSFHFPSVPSDCTDDLSFCCV